MPNYRARQIGRLRVDQWSCDSKKNTLLLLQSKYFSRETYRKRYSRGLRILGQVRIFYRRFLRKKFLLDFIAIKESSHNSSSVPNSFSGHFWVFRLLYGPRYVWKRRSSAKKYPNRNLVGSDHDDNGRLRRCGTNFARYFFIRWKNSDIFMRR